MTPSDPLREARAGRLLARLALTGLVVIPVCLVIALLAFLGSWELRPGPPPASPAAGASLALRGEAAEAPPAAAGVPQPGAVSRIPLPGGFRGKPDAAPSNPYRRPAPGAPEGSDGEGPERG